MGLTKTQSGGLADESVTLAKLLHGDGSSDGKFLRANNGADPTFETVSGTTINNNANNRVITGSGTANTLEGEDNLTFDDTNNVLSAGGGLGIQNVSGTIMGNGGGQDYLTIKDSGNTARLVVKTHGTGIGNVGIGTTSPGKNLDVNGEIRASSGILFGSDTAAANTISDYEEGSYTPTLTGISGTTSITLYEDKLSYTKIGTRIMISGRLRMNAANYSGGLRMSLPFAAASGTSCSNCGMSAVGTHGVNFPNSDDMGLFIETFAGQSLADFVITRDNSGWINATSSHITQYNYLAFNMHYQTS